MNQYFYNTFNAAKAKKQRETEMETLLQPHNEYKQHTVDAFILLPCDSSSKAYVTLAQVN